MTQQIYRVGGYWADGTYPTHLVGATSPKHAGNCVLVADRRFKRLVKAVALTDEQVEALK